jgi:multidrug efflux pump
VTLGSENYDFNVAFNGVRSVFIGIKVAPEANILDVAKRVRTVFLDLQSQLPTGLTGEIVYDSTEFINTSISEVIKTLIEALVIVTVVIYLFLGSFRAVMVPVIAMPLSLIGTFFVMLMLGYSINLLTLLALVLAIGLVVDDAIIVVENVDRHMKEGKSPMQAIARRARAGRADPGDDRGADRGVRADRLPGRPDRRAVHRIRVHAGGRGGGVGHRRADAVADDVLALLRSPSRTSGKFVKAIDRTFEKVHNGYQRMLRSLLNTWPVLIVMGVILVALLA